MPDGNYEYRLRQQDLDGHVAYLQSITIRVSHVAGIGGSGVMLPTEFSLHQNYPNPFNPSTAIDFELPENSSVHLAVYNMLGQQVGVLVDGSVSAGTHSVLWNALHAPSGMYQYRMDAVSLSDPAKHYSQSRKMLLVK